MTIIKHELRQGKAAFLIWTAAIGFLLAVCIFLFPEMQGQMESVGDIFSSMGSFTTAFGMDKLNFGTLLGFYSVECGNILGLGGAFYAAICAVGMLSKEEKEKTAEFLFTHPITRRRVITEKLTAVFLQITAMNLIIYAAAAGSMTFIGEDVPWKELTLLHSAYFIMQLELAGLCFGISAFIRKSSTGIGLGVAAIMYFLNIVANITDAAEFLKFITPFAYTEGADIIDSGCLDGVKITVGVLLGIIGIIVAYVKYCKKDIS